MAVIFNADYVRKLQAESIRQKEELENFIITHGIEKDKFEKMMNYIRMEVPSFANATNTDNKAVVHITKAYWGTPYWRNENFRKNLSHIIEKNYSKISTAFCNELESLGFKVEADMIDWALLEGMTMTQELPFFKEIELTIMW